MKFLYGLLLATNLNNSPVEMHSKEISISTKLDIFNKNLEDKNLDNKSGKSVIKNKNASQLLFSKELCEFYDDTRIKDLKIVVNYEIEFVTRDIRNTVMFNQTFSDQMVEQKNNNSFKATDTKGKEISFDYGSDENKFIGNFKDGRHAVQVRPYLSFNFKEYENPYMITSNHGYIHFYISGISLKGNANVINLSAIKQQPIKIEYDSIHNPYIVDEWLSSNKLEILLHNKYGLPEDFIDKNKTIKNASIEKLNHLKINKIFINIVPSKKYFYKGALEQELDFYLSTKRSEDFNKINKLFSKEIYQQLTNEYFDPKDLEVRINLSNEKIGIDGLGTLDFMNNGYIKDAFRFKKITIIKDGEVIAQTVDNRWDIKSYADLENLVEWKALDHSEKEPEKVSDINNEDKEKISEYEDTKIDDVNENKMTSNKKSNPLKYLWLLVIPICLGFLTLISWFIPFNKRRKSK